MLYTGLVRKGILSLERLVELMTLAPRRRFGLPVRDNDCCVWNLAAEYEIDPAEFASMGKATPFAGHRVFGRCLKTVHNGRTVYREENQKYGKAD